MNEGDGRTLSDGKRLEGRLKNFGKRKVKKEIEIWLGEITGMENYVLTDCKIIKGLEGCHRQELHSNFDVEEKEELTKFFGIMPLQCDNDLWIKPKNEKEEFMKIINKGDVFLGDAPLIHAGGEKTGERFHFLYVKKGLQKKFQEYKVTTFVTSEG